MKKVIYILIMLFIVLISSCESQTDGNNNDNESTKTTVAVSIVPEEAFVEAVAGDLVDVVTMIPPGASPANYQPTIKQMKQLSSSKIYFSIGVPTEKANIMPKLKGYNNDIKIIQLEEVVGDVYEHLFFDVDGQEHKNEEDHNDGHEHEGRDPHIWMSPKRVIIMVEKIKEELINIDENNKEIYEKNAKKYIDKLGKIDSEIRNLLKDTTQNSFIIFHPSLGYFADDYNLEMIAIEESGKEATAKRFEKVINLAKEKDIKFIFYQEEFDDSQAKTIANEINGETIKVNPLSIDYIDNLKNIAKAFKNVLK